MKIEDEIKQTKPFASPFIKLAVNVSYTHFWFQELQKGALESYDITLQQFNILKILKGQYPKPSSIILIKERMIDKGCDASRIVERLRAKGYVERERCDEDRRLVEVLITEEGKKVLDSIDEKNKNGMPVELSLTEKEVASLSNLLDKLRDSKIYFTIDATLL